MGFPRVHPNSLINFSFDLNDFLIEKNVSIFNYFSIVGRNIGKSTQCNTPTCGGLSNNTKSATKRHHFLGNLNATNKTNLPFVHRSF
jgi:hypothetical protein